MKTRIFWLDAVKGMAISLVVLAHILWVQDASASSSLTDSFLTANRILASLGVPLFVMASGALLLSKQFHSKADICAFYRRGLLPLILSAWIWIAAYCVFNVRPFSFKELLLCMMFVHKPEVHLWYVRVILICYLTVPFINMLRRKCGFIVWPLLILLAGFTFCYNGWLILNSSMCPTSPARSYFCYFVYMALGYWLSRTQVSRKGIVLVALIVVSGGAILYVSLMRNSYFLWYDNPMICLISMGVFYLTRAMLGIRGQNANIVEISKMTYGIYLSHFFLIYFLKNFGWSVLTFYLAWIVTIVVDIALIQILRRISSRFSRLVMRY